jgi:hypothetical protein
LNDFETWRAKGRLTSSVPVSLHDRRSPRLPMVKLCDPLRPTGRRAAHVPPGLLRAGQRQAPRAHLVDPNRDETTPADGTCIQVAFAAPMSGSLVLDATSTDGSHKH